MLSRLTDLLTTSSPADWTKVTGAIELLDRQLQDEPMQLEESRDGEQRIAFVGPLIVSFEIDQMNRRVTLLAVAWRGAGEN